jgi:hypothetical protein
MFWSHYSYLGLDPSTLKDQYADYWASIGRGVRGEWWAGARGRWWQVGWAEEGSAVAREW